MRITNPQFCQRGPQTAQIITVSSAGTRRLSDLLSHRLERSRAQVVRVIGLTHIGQRRQRPRLRLHLNHHPLVPPLFTFIEVGQCLRPIDVIDAVDDPITMFPLTRQERHHTAGARRRPTVVGRALVEAARKVRESCFESLTVGESWVPNQRPVPKHPMIRSSSLAHSGGLDHGRVKVARHHVTIELRRRIEPNRAIDQDTDRLKLKGQRLYPAEHTAPL